jgi:hypothetical protein
MTSQSISVMQRDFWLLKFKKLASFRSSTKAHLVDAAELALLVDSQSGAHVIEASDVIRPVEWIIAGYYEWKTRWVQISRLNRHRLLVATLNRSSIDCIVADSNLKSLKALMDQKYSLTH